MADGTETVVKATKSLAQEFRAATKQAQITAQNYGILSKEGLKAATAAGKLRDELEDYRTIERALGGDAPVFTAMGQGLQVAASGFAAAQGAAALFGKENEDVQRTLLKVQAAMALTQGLAGLAAAKDAVIALNAVMLANPVTAMIVGFTALGVAGYQAGNIISETFEESDTTLDKVNKTVSILTMNVQGMMLVQMHYLKVVSLSQQEYNKILISGAESWHKIQQDNIAIEELRLRASKSGKALELGLIDLNLKKQLETAQYSFDISKKTFGDKVRLEQSISAFKKLAENDRLRVEQEYIKKSKENKQKAAEEEVQDELDKYKKIEQAENDALIRAQMNDAIYGPKKKKVELDLTFGSRKSALSAFYESAADEAARGLEILNKKIIATMANAKQTLVAAMSEMGLAAVSAMGASFVTGDVDLSGLYSIFASVADAIAKQMLALGAAIALAGPEFWGKAAQYFAAAAALELLAGASNAYGQSQKGSNAPGQTVSVQPTGIPKMADGGILTKPTLFLGGEYAGASSNPEIVTPLSKLKEFMGSSAGMQAIVVTGRLDGRMIKLQAARQSRFDKRVYGR
ncbi:MAG: hypothetical protein WC760_02955 [Bacteroidia bacterium]